MTKASKPPTLLDPKGMGGIVAQDGFDYQVAIGLIKLPGWLANPAFEQLIFEGLEDVEARLFNPYAPKLHVLERIQAKSGGLSKSGLKAVFAAFKAFEDHHPDTANVQTLVTPQLPSTLMWISRDPKRVRNARPFYAPFGDVTRATDAQLQTSFRAEFGTTLGDFVCASVEVKLEPVTDNEQAAARFASSLVSSFPHTAALAGGTLTQVFQTLLALATRRRGQPLDRALLLQEIKTVLGRALMEGSAFPVHLRSARQEEPQPNSLEIDASAFSGPGGSYPPPSVWADQLTRPLTAIGGWLRKRGFRDVLLSGGYRISTALLIGWSFRSASGFEIQIPTKQEFWRTDARGDTSLASPAVDEPSQLADGVLHVAVGILRDPATALIEGGLPGEQLLRLHLGQPVTSAEMAQALVLHIKSAVERAVGRLRPKAIYLYFAGPAAVAVALGHRWNAMPQTQLHEFVVAEQRYQQTAVLG